MVFHRAQQPTNSKGLLENSVSIFHLESEETQLSVVLIVCLSLIPHTSIHFNYSLHCLDLLGFFFSAADLQ